MGCIGVVFGLIFMDVFIMHTFLGGVFPRNPFLRNVFLVDVSLMDEGDCGRHLYNGHIFWDVFGVSLGCSLKML